MTVMMNTMIPALPSAMASQRLRFGSENPLSPAENPGMPKDDVTLIPYEPEKTPVTPDKSGSLPELKVMSEAESEPPRPHKPSAIASAMATTMLGFLGGTMGALLTLAALVAPSIRDGRSVQIPIDSGINPAAMAPEVIGRRADDAKELLASAAQSTDPLAAHLKKLTNYVKPAVVEVQKSPNYMGTGFFCSSDGLIMTNAHVVTEGRGNVVPTVMVTLYNGQKLSGRVIGADPITDLALVRVDRKDCPTLSFATSSPEAGDMVMALGHPEFLSWSQTLGTISATNRDLPGLGFDMIQTDAAINPGNSGGPLVNMHGEVVSVIKAIWQGNNSQGLGIPARTVQEVMSQLLFNSDEKIPLPPFLLNPRDRMESPFLPPEGRQIPEFPKLFPPSDTP